MAVFLRGLLPWRKQLPYLNISKSNAIYYHLIDGDPHRPHVVFLHEGLGCAAMWKNFPEQLCRRTGCAGVVYDRLGYGRSSPLRNDRTLNYIHEYALQELPEVLTAVIPDCPYILIGHSDGASIALVHAAQAPRRLRGVITEAAHVFVEQITIEGIEEAERGWRQGKFRGLDKYHGTRAEAVFKAWTDTWLAHWFREWTIENLLEGIAAPLLVIQGADDQYGSIGQVDAIVAGSSSSAQRLIIEGCGHAPHLEAREVVLNAMADFINLLDHTYSF
ncbi:MAG: alpha/beta fold hydrolase [Desulfopila sp.]